jgi:hypothetical protein
MAFTEGRLVLPAGGIGGVEDGGSGVAVRETGEAVPAGVREAALWVIRPGVETVVSGPGVETVVSGPGVVGVLQADNRKMKTNRQVKYRNIISPGLIDRIPQTNLTYPARFTV